MELNKEPENSEIATPFNPQFMTQNTEITSTTNDVSIVSFTYLPNFLRPFKKASNTEIIATNGKLNDVNIIRMLNCSVFKSKLEI
jgi:hypothetical protein